MKNTRLTGQSYIPNTETYAAELEKSIDKIEKSRMQLRYIIRRLFPPESQYLFIDTLADSGQVIYFVAI